jgi:fatty-acyl-CoA synthase
MSRNRATISFSPPFGYELCARRVSDEDVAHFDLSAWRIAGVGAEMIMPEPLNAFTDALHPAGFRKDAFMACYGMAECSLAVTFPSLEAGLSMDTVDADALAETQCAVPVMSDEAASRRTARYVICGVPLPCFEVQIRDSKGNVLPERRCGTLFVRGPSVMSGYYGDAEATEEVLSPDGWFNTGDLAYRISDTIVITGREKDLIIINGRNIWPQDLEYLAQLQPEVRSGGASAFSVPGPQGEEKAVMLIECRAPDEQQRRELMARIYRMIREEHGIECLLYIVPRNTLPRTTSGKLSRSAARRDFLKRASAEGLFCKDEAAA